MRTSSATPTPPNTSMRFPVVLFIILSVLFVASTVGLFIAAQRTARHEHVRVARRLNKLADEGNQLVRTWWSDNIEDARRIAETYSLLRIDPTVPFADRAAGGEKRLESKDRTRELALIDLAGSALSHRAFPLAVQPPTAKALARLRRTSAVEYTPFFRLPGDSSLFVDIVAPVRPAGARAKPALALLMRINLRSEAKTLFGSPAGSEEFLLIGRENSALIPVNEPRHPISHIFPLTMGGAGGRLPSALLSEGYRGIIEGLDYRGVPVVAALRGTGVLGLGLLTKIDKEEAYVRLFGWRHRLVLIAVIEALLALLLILIVRHNRRMADLRRRAQWDASCRSALDGVQRAALGLDEKDCITYVNPYLARLLGVSQEQAAGQPWIDTYVSDSYRDTVRATFAGMRAGNRQNADLEYPIITAESGERLIRWNSTTTRGAEGSVCGTMSIGEDVTDVRAADEALKRQQQQLDVLCNIGRSLSEASTLGQLLEEVLSQTLEAVDFDAGTVRFRTNESHFTLAAHQGFGDEAPDEVIRVSRADHPSCDALLRGKVVFQTADGDIPERLADVLAKCGMKSLVAVPLSEHGAVIGMICLLSREIKALTTEQEQLLLAVGQRAGVGIARIRLTEADREGHLRAQHLARLASRLTSAHSYQTTLDMVLEELSTFLDLKLAVYYEANEDSALRIVAASGHDEETVRYIDAEKPIPTSLLSLPAAMRCPLIHATSEVPLSTDGDETRTEGESLTLPLMEAGQLLGVLQLSFNERRTFTEAELGFLDELTKLVVPEMQKAKLHDELSALNRSLTATNAQRTLQLEQERDRVNAILLSVTDGIIVTDLDRRIILANPAAQRMFGIAGNDDIPLTIEAALGDEVASEIMPRRIGSSYALPEAELSVTTPDGDRLVLAAHTAQVRSRDGVGLGCVTVFHDVTRAHELDAMKTAFISTAAHELRTPLTTLRGYSEILLSRDIPRKEQRRFLEYINQQSVILSDIISDLLDLSRFEAFQPGMLNLAPCDLREICRTEANLVHETTTTHRIDTSQVRGVPPILGDRDRLAQVVRNLLSNAIKYSPKGDIIVRCYANAHRVHLEVQDFGIGMTKEQVQNIFNKFYRADAFASAVPGTGLGMSIVKQLVRRHGGVVWVESEQGEGTTVHVAFLVMGAKPVALLVGTDNEALQPLIVGFSESGWHTTVAPTTEEGVERARSELPNIGVVALPIESLQKFIKELDADQRAADLALLVVAEHHDAPAIQRMCRGRVVEIVPSNADPDTIRDKAAVLDRRRRGSVDVVG